MKILYIHQYFKTPREPGGTRSYWIARKLIEEGHDVYMITTSSSISKAKVINNIDGINVLYLRIPYNNKMSIFARAISFVRFMLGATWHALKLKSVGLVIATSTPLTVGFPALTIKKLKNIPYIFEVRDLWPEVPIQMGGITNTMLIRFAKWFEKTVYKNASHIIALSPGMKDGILSTGIMPDKVSMITNMAKIKEFYPRAKNFDLTEKFNLKSNSFKAIHFGALGIANGLETIIESARLLKNNDNIEFIFMGNGAMESRIRQLSLEYELDNIKFIGSHPMKLVSEIVNFCDISIVSFLDLPILYTNSPNKLFDSLSAGKPVIVNSAGWTKNLVEEHKCGYYANPNKPEELADQILHLATNPSIVNEMGHNARKLAKSKYDKSLLSHEFANVVNKI